MGSLEGSIRVTIRITIRVQGLGPIRVLIKVANKIIV